MALVNLAGFLEKHSKPYRIRGVNSTTFADLREQPSVLIGAFDNEWTLRSVGHLRYTFQRTFVDGNEIAMVRDRDHPEKTDWKLAGFWPDWNSISTDYAIVSRVLDVNTERMTVITAGITHFGTVGGGEFLTTPAYMAEAIPQLPRGWQRRNVQIVLRIPVVRGASGRPHVLATYVW
jgi:hypothetical protein